MEIPKPSTQPHAGTRHGDVPPVAGPALGAILIGWAAERLGLGLPMSVSICLGIVLWLAALRSIFRNRGELEGQ